MRLVCKMFASLSYSVRRSCMKHKVYYRVSLYNLMYAYITSCMPI